MFFSVKMGGNELTSQDYTFTNNKLNISKPAQGDILISADTINKPASEYKVTFIREKANWHPDWFNVGISIVYGSQDTLTQVDSTGNYRFITVKDDDENLGCTIVEYLGDADADTITVPNTLTPAGGGISYPVKEVGSYVFYGYNATETVVFETTELEAIGSYCFSYCSALTSVQGLYDSKLERIESYAFGGCTELAFSSPGDNLIMPSTLKEIGIYAFAYCYSLIDISFLNCNDLKSFDTGVFYYCKGLKTIQLPSVITYLGDNVFEHCESLVTLTISTSGINTIPYALCYECQSLKSFYWTDSNNLVRIGNSAFGGCVSMKTFINADNNLPDNVSVIEDYAFSRCTSMSKFVIGNSQAHKNLTMGLEVFRGWTSNQTLYLSQALVDYAGAFVTNPHANWGWTLARGISLDTCDYVCAASGSATMVIHVNQN